MPFVSKWWKNHWLFIACFFTFMIITSISGFFPVFRTSGKVFVFTYFFWLREFSDRSSLKMENIPVSESQFQKNSEPWWVLVSPEVGLASSPLNWWGPARSPTWGPRRPTCHTCPATCQLPCSQERIECHLWSPDVIRYLSCPHLHERGLEGRPCSWPVSLQFQWPSPVSSRPLWWSPWRLRSGDQVQVPSPVNWGLCKLHE